ncbi:hypothetical protein TNCV_289261 [Trichonephila clavipes]|nr:hypothetical protein TNCV_289261 [Trichonephila clavipes]
MEAKNENKIKQEENLDADEEKLKQPITIIKNDIRFEDLQTFFQKYSLEIPIQKFIRNFESACDSFEIPEKQKILFIINDEDDTRTDSPFSKLLHHANVGTLSIGTPNVHQSLYTEYPRRRSVMSRRKQRSAFDQVSEFDRRRIVACRDCGFFFRKIGNRVG